METLLEYAQLQHFLKTEKLQGLKKDAVIFEQDAKDSQRLQDLGVQFYNKNVVIKAWEKIDKTWRKINDLKYDIKILSIAISKLESGGYL